MLLLSSFFPKRKKGLSNLIAYVLLITISISLSVLVYGWLKFYASGSEALSCPNNVNLVIENYSCISGDYGNFSVTLKNKGFFTVHGYVLRVHDREGAEFGLYVFDEAVAPIKPGESLTASHEFSEYTSEDIFESIRNITFIDVQPFLVEDGERVLCEAYASVDVVCD